MEFKMELKSQQWNEDLTLTQLVCLETISKLVVMFNLQYKTHGFHNLVHV